MMKLELITKKTNNKKYIQPLLFIHGASVGAWMMQPFLTFFAHLGFDAYALSLRGHGASEGHDQIDQFGLNDYVEDLNQTIRQLKEKPILIGHSMGGAVVQAYLNQYPCALDYVILLSSAPANGIEKQSPLGMFYQDKLSFMRSLRKTQNPLTFEALLSKVLFSNRVKEELVLNIRSQLSKESTQMSIQLLKPFIENISKIKTNVLVIGSKVDQAIPIEATLQTAKAFQVEALWMPDVCHFLTYDPNFENAAYFIYRQIDIFATKKS
jgi:pimeloyl-ACP methyl ester carboxylesterase